MVSGSQSSDVNYALITRVFDPDTENWIIALGGFKWQSTSSLSSLLLNPTYAGMFPPSLRSAKNFQLVVRTSVVNRTVNAPQIVALYTW